MCKLSDYTPTRWSMFHDKATYGKHWSFDRTIRAWAYLEHRKTRHLEPYRDHFGAMADAQLLAERFHATGGQHVRLGPYDVMPAEQRARIIATLPTPTRKAVSHAP